MPGGVLFVGLSVSEQLLRSLGYYFTLDGRASGYYWLLSETPLDQKNRFKLTLKSIWSGSEEYDAAA